ncbi:conserved domain-containing protein [Blastococcus fimeti]|nr:conserved domain-containing protein [Blastococcus fimeti]
MIGTETLDRVIGKDVYDEAGQKIGSAGEVYLDDETGQPEWVTVRTGMFGTKETFVPIRDADLTDDGLRVPVSKDRVKDAPKIDTDGHLSPQEEQELYRYYGMGTGGTGTETTGREHVAGTESTTVMAMEDTSGRHMAGTGTVGTGTTDTDTNRHGTVGHDTSGPTTDDAMTRSEERMTVGTTTEETGRARLRKYVVSENVTQTVPVTREEVRVEREPITDANVGNAMDGPAISEEEHEVTLHAERAVVEKEAVPVERVRLDKTTVTEQEQVSADLRKEEIEVDGARDDERRR